MTDALAEALAELYVIDGRYEKAFALYANVVQLMMTDYKRAVPLLTQHKDLITASKVVNFWLWGISVIPYTFYICICFHYLKLIRMLEGISMICRFEI
ncbi:vacuolar protein sorting-associated protein 41 homolog [Camellia sinensis]|uniref:vacuolar protein sorting-associated protein 41 homolog n=1 Tax=Camellia sinensis TaxID=4442 RepID=UPI0010365EEB|nr:vacuolar protein sorting-associated protein 41 homolog [Camellia sinensis]